MFGTKLPGIAFMVVGVTLILLLAPGCGQDPSFLEREGMRGSADSNPDDQVSTIPGSTDDYPGAGGDSGAGGDGYDTTTSGTPGDANNPMYDPDAEEALLPSEGGTDWMPDWVSGNEDGDSGPNGGSGTDGGTYDIPAADGDDLGALHKCLSKWNNLPFDKTITNYHKISAAVTVGGYGNAVNDYEHTPQPQLILIDAGVNVLGAPSYNLLNRNGYYCMKVNVNVLTDFTINLHCNARLADSKVNVNVGSNQNDTTSDVGVHVLSEVQIVTVRPEGDNCLR